MSEQIKEELEQNVALKGPGDRLQAARIEQGVTIEDIARQMNLNTKILQSIEDDDYSDIQSPIFMRGYLRTYARLVGENEDEMIKIFGEYYQKSDPDIKTIGNTAAEISSNDIRVKWVTYIVVIGLLILLSVWWVNNYRVNETTNATDTIEQSVNQSIEPLLDQPTEQSESISLINDQSGLIVDSPIASEVEETQIDNLQPAEIEQKESVENDLQSDTNAVISTSNNEPENAMMETPESEPQAEQSLSEEEMLAVAPTENSEESEPNSESTVKTFTKEVSAPQGSDVLEINIIASSWGDIKDASKFRLMQDLMNSGTRYRLVGQAPFNVFLGNGFGVELTLNGVAYDFSNQIKSSNNTARFEVGN